MTSVKYLSLQKAMYTRVRKVEGESGSLKKAEEIISYGKSL